MRDGMKQSQARQGNGTNGTVRLLHTWRVGHINVGSMTRVSLSPSPESICGCATSRRVGHIASGRYHWVCVGALTETKTGVPDCSRFSRSRPLAANGQAGVFKLFSTQWPTPRYRGYFNIRVMPHE